MPTSQQQLVCDNSTLANFKQWAMAISGFFTTATWTQSTDTGQVNWSTIPSVPGSSAYVYEVWQPNDGLTNFYLKVEYGNGTGTNCPALRLTLSTTTNGAGTATGFIAGPIITANSGFTIPSSSTQYECDFSGAAGRIGGMLWRNAPIGSNAPQQLFAVERSVNSSGVYTSNYVTLWTNGSRSGTDGRTSQQQSLVFGLGAAPISPQTNAAGGWIVRTPRTGSGTSFLFNGTIPFDTCAPFIGSYDFNCTMCGAVNGFDIAEGVTFTATLYGSTRTYMPSKTGWFANVTNINGGNEAICMRYD